MSITDKKYRSNRTTKFCCRYHVIFCPKYRRKVLTDEIATRFIEITQEVLDENNSYLIEAEVMPDHVHLLIDSDPDIGICKIIKRIKGRTSNILRKEFRELTTKLPCLWTSSKLILSVGAVSLDVVKKYIQEQKGK